MPSKKVVAKCPRDACPMTPFAVRPASFGYTISLYGCVYCNFDFVVAVATDVDGNTRPVARGSLDPTSGQYTLAEQGNNLPGWFALARAALPNRQQSEQHEQQ